MTEKKVRPQRRIYCATCRRVIADDYGGRDDRAMVIKAVTDHVGYPQSAITRGIVHELETIDILGQITVRGVALRSDVVH